jgi:hypothetical protein
MIPTATRQSRSWHGIRAALSPYYGGGADAAHPNLGLSQCHGCATEDTVTPHASFIALDVMPQEACANIQMLRTLYPGIYDPNGGFYDAVNRTTGSIGHRRLVLDQSMIMAALDNALNNGAMQHFTSDPVSWAARLYLSVEQMSIS